MKLLIYQNMRTCKFQKSTSILTCLFFFVLKYGTMTYRTPVGIEILIRFSRCLYFSCLHIHNTLLTFDWFTYIYICLKIKRNSSRIRFLRSVTLCPGYDDTAQIIIQNNINV